MQGVIDRHRHASLIGCIVFQDVSVGAMLAMLVDTMIPEAFAKAPISPAWVGALASSTRSPSAGCTADAPSHWCDATGKSYLTRCFSSLRARVRRCMPRRRAASEMLKSVSASTA